MSTDVLAERQRHSDDVLHRLAAELQPQTEKIGDKEKILAKRSRSGSLLSEINLDFTDCSSSERFSDGDPIDRFRF